MLAGMKKWADFNKVYLTYFNPDRLPTRSAFGAASLALGAQVEVEAWAWSGKNRKYAPFLMPNLINGMRIFEYLLPSPGGSYAPMLRSAKRRSGQGSLY